MFGFKNYGNNDTRSGFGIGLVEAASKNKDIVALCACLLYTSPSPRDQLTSRMPSSA